MSVEIMTILGLSGVGFFFVYYHLVLKDHYEKTEKKEKQKKGKKKFKNFVVSLQVDLFKFMALVVFLVLPWIIYFLMSANNGGAIYTTTLDFLFKFNFVLTGLFILPVVEVVVDIALALLNSVNNINSEDEDYDD